jgi:hypothetical protein
MKKAALISLLILLPVMAWGFNAVPTGTEVTLTWQEPSYNTDGTPLTDLAKIRVYDNHTGVTSMTKEVPASGPTGGATGSTIVTVPVVAGQERTVIFYLTAVDDDGNESPPSNTKTVNIDKLSPAAPE